MSEMVELFSSEPGTSRKGVLPLLNAIRLKIQKDVQEAMANVSQAVYVAYGKGSLDLILESLPSRPRNTDLRILVLDSVSNANLSLLHAHFRIVVSQASSLKLLPTEELADVLQADNREDIFIAGRLTSSHLLLYRGNLEPLTVPRTWFARRPRAKPNFSRFSLTDYGQTIKLGEYEAAGDAILYEFDEDFRRRAKQRLVEEDRSLGGSIRRLRLQKGLRQSDFPGLSSKEIARIEKGLVSSPHEETLRIIASVTGVSPAALHTY